MSSSSDDKPISQRVEQSIEGLLSFVWRLVRTTSFIVMRPFSAVEIMATCDLTDQRVFAHPFTFLATGGFVFTLVLSVYPVGPSLNVVDLVFLTDEVTKTLVARIEESFTISGLIAAAFPVLLVVSAASIGYARLTLQEKFREPFVRLACYCYGALTFLFFSVIFLQVAVEVFGDVFSSWPLWTKRIAGTLSAGVFWGLLLLVPYMLLIPSLVLGTWSFRQLSDFSLLRRVVGSVTTIACAALLIPTLFFAGSVPGTLRELSADSPPEISLHIVTEETASGEVEWERQRGAYVDFELSLVIDNATDKPVILPESALEVHVSRAASEDGDGDLCFSSERRLLLDGRSETANAILVQPKSAASYELVGRIVIGETLRPWTLAQLRGEPDLRLYVEVQLLDGRAFASTSIN